MAIDLTTFWSGWDVVSGNTQATNQYEFWKGMVMTNGQVLASEYDFYTYHNTTKYEWFRDLQFTYPEVYDEYTFYRNTSDNNIYDYRTFYEFGAQYLVPIAITPTPTPTFTPTPSPTSIQCESYTISNDGFGSTIFNWVNCNGTAGTITLSFGASTNICAQLGSVTFDSNGTIINNGACPTPTPTPTPTITPTNT